MSEQQEPAAAPAPETFARGPDIPVEADPKSWPQHRGGTAEGVFFLGEVAVTSHTRGEHGLPTVVKQVLVESLERRAIPYLRPVDPTWPGLRQRMVGLGRPNVEALVPEHLRALAVAQNRTVEYLFNTDRAVGVHAQAPEVAAHWRFVEVEPGVVAVYYV